MPISASMKFRKHCQAKSANNFLKVSIWHSCRRCTISVENRQYRSAITNIKLIVYYIAVLINIKHIRRRYVSILMTDR